MAMSSKHFGNMVLLYFYPLIFIGEVVILNITTAVKSSKINVSERLLWTNLVYVIIDLPLTPLN
jgi:hypothetical protein